MLLIVAIHVVAKLCVTFGVPILLFFGKSCLIHQCNSCNYCNCFIVAISPIFATNVNQSYYSHNCKFYKGLSHFGAPICFSLGKVA